MRDEGRGTMGWTTEHEVKEGVIDGLIDMEIRWLVVV